MYGLPQAGVLAHQKLSSILAPHGYAPTKNTPGLWTHSSRPIIFALVVDDFGVKYAGEEHAHHLLNILLANYEGVHEDWGGTKFCGITLEWDYIQRTCLLSMPGYIEAILVRFHHQRPRKPELSPHRYASRSFNAANAQSPIPDDDSARLDAAGVLRVQRIVGSILYYARALDAPLLRVTT